MYFVNYSNNVHIIWKYKFAVNVKIQIALGFGKLSNIHIQTGSSDGKRQVFSIWSFRWGGIKCKLKKNVLQVHQTMGTELQTWYKNPIQMPKVNWRYLSGSKISAYQHFNEVALNAKSRICTITSIVHAYKSWPMIIVTPL